MEMHDARSPAVVVENRIYLALGDLYNLEPAEAIDIAGRISLQMTAIVGDAIMQNGATEHRLAALQYIEDALVDLTALRAQVRGPSPVHS